VDACPGSLRLAELYCRATAAASDGPAAARAAQISAVAAAHAPTPSLLLARGRCWWYAGGKENFDQAREDWRAAARLDPDGGGAAEAQALLQASLFAENDSNASQITVLV
jgi:hypothetical protein